MTEERQKQEEPEFLDDLGQLCKEGEDIAKYLFQVPDDQAQRDKLSRVVDAILADKSMALRKEFPKLAGEMKELLSQPPSVMNSQMLQAGFDRMTRLWQSARSGMF